MQTANDGRPQAMIAMTAAAMPIRSSAPQKNMTAP